MLANIAQEIDQRDAGEPVGIVEQERRMVTGIEIEELGELPLDRFHVRGNLLLAQQRTFLRLATWIADQTGAAAGQRNRNVAPALEAGQREQRQEMPDVETVGAGIEADVEGHALAPQRVFETFAALVQQSAPAQFVQNSGHRPVHIARHVSFIFR